MKMFVHKTIEELNALTHSELYDYREGLKSWQMSYRLKLDELIDSKYIEKNKKLMARRKITEADEAKHMELLKKLGDNLSASVDLLKSAPYVGPKPSLRQEWLLSTAINDIICVPAVPDMFHPFRYKDDREINAFMKRMVASGWLDHDRGVFYRTTAQADMYMRTVSKKKVYHEMFDKNGKEIKPNKK